MVIDALVELVEVVGMGEEVLLALLTNILLKEAVEVRAIA